MRTTKGAFFALTVLGGVFAWRNRFAIQRRFEAMGIKTPLLKGTIEDAARSIASQARGKMEHGATVAETIVDRKIS